MEPGRKIAVHACEPRIFSPTSPMRSPMVRRPLPFPFPLPALLATDLEPHPVGVAVVAVALVGIAVTGRHARLAEDDHARRAPVDAQGASRADVLVDHE